MPSTLVMAQPVDGGGLCPTCGGLLLRDRLIVDLDTNTISYDGRRWHASPKLAEFLFTLNKAWPGLVKDFDLRQALWGPDAYERSSKNLFIYACRARQMLLPYDIGVARVFDKGFRLTMPTSTHP